MYEQKNQQVSSRLSVPEVPRTSQVQEALEQLANRLSILNERRDALEHRMSAVLRQTVPPATPGNQPKEVLVPVAESIRSAVLAVESQIDAIQSMLDRLEL